ncbi:MAG: hypothetical protein KGR23_02870 [Betaproteobacteria bacterium]|nr:hypothetical protein [Betaproteobacteria bacterium]
MRNLLIRYLLATALCCALIATAANAADDVVAAPADATGAARVEGLHEIAATGDGGIWTVTPGLLWFVDRDGAVRGSLPLLDGGYGAGVKIAADPFDGSAWLVTRAKLLLRVAPDGALLAGTTLYAVPDAVTIALDQSLWLLSGRELAHHAQDGRWLETRSIPNALGAGGRMLAVDSLGERLWIVSTNEIVQVPLDPMQPPLSMPIPAACNIAAATLAPRNGWLFVSCADRLIAFDRTGRIGLDAGLRKFGIDEVDRLAHHGGTDTILVAGPAATLRIADDGSTLEILDAATADALARPAPFSILPTLALIRPPDGAATDDPGVEIVLGVGASCNGHACSMPAGYLEGMKLDVHVNGLPVADPSIDARSGRARLGAALPIRSGINRIVAQATDRFGHPSERVEATLTIVAAGTDASAARARAAGTDASPAQAPAAGSWTDANSSPAETRAWTVKAANKAPSVALTAPSPGAIFSAGGNIALAASASDSDGSISRVEFYRDGTILLGTATASPYAILWTNVGVGTYKLTASAYDNRNSKATSAPVSITVVGNQAPVVALTSPADGSFHVAGAPIDLRASASDLDGSVTRVEFFDGSMSLGSALTTPWAWTWLDARAGRHAITARATDNRGATSSSTIAYITVGEGPNVVVTQPTGCSQADGPLDLMISADAASATGSIARVDFFDGANLVGSAYRPPWRVTLAGATAGMHSITARATDSHGLATTSRPSLVEVRAPNRRPTVSITTPIDGARYALGSDINLAAVAADPDGTISAVEYRIGAGGAIIGRATSAPYAVAWRGVASGTYALVAIAYDDRGDSTASATVTVTVNANVAPVVTLTAPVEGGRFVAPATIALAASASDTDGSVARVDFYAGSMLVGTATTTPFTATWSNAPAGSYSVSAKATDNLGATATSSPASVTITANAPPVVSLTAPVPGSAYFAPATMTLAASATDPDGTVDKVEFFANGSVVGTAYAPPFSIVWDAVAGGTYALAARATDNVGTTSSSSPITVEVAGAPMINFGPGLANAIIDDDRVTVRGYVSAPDNAAVTVNGIVAHIDDSGHFNLNDLPLAVGRNTITAVVTGMDGQTATQEITLESTGPAPFIVDASPTEGLGSLTVQFSIANPAHTPFDKIIVDLDGDGYPNLIATPSDIDNRSYAFTATYPQGTWTATITALDAANQPIFSTTRVIVVLMPEFLEGRLRAIYSGMLARLRAGNIPGAMTAFTGSAYAKYEAIFTQLGAALPGLIDQLGEIEETSFGVDLAEFSIVRNTSDGLQRFMVYLIRAEDGIWRIDGM